MRNEKRESILYPENKNEELRNLIDRIKKEANKNPAFVGLGLRGSAFKGYAIGGSDIDIVILFDSAKIKPEKDENLFALEYQRLGVNFFWLNINPEEAQKNPKYLIKILAALTELTSGKKLDEYVETYKNFLNTLESTERDRYKKLVLQKIMDSENASYDKRKARIPNLPPKDEFLAQKFELWTEHFDDFWEK